MAHCLSYTDVDCVAERNARVFEEVKGSRDILGSNPFLFLFLGFLYTCFQKIFLSRRWLDAKVVPKK